MSLAFLSKKSWHTANLRNVEKVWIAEQKHAAEEKKVVELRKNIEEERQIQELRKLQAAHGDKSAAMERVDWMYEGPSAAREKTAEEYLLGKEYKSDDEKAAKEDVETSTSSKYGSLALSKSTLPAHDAFQRLNEDPMMLIRKKQQAAREQVLMNPVKMKKIKEQVIRLKGDKKARKRAKKAAKKEKKHARKEAKRQLKKSNQISEANDTSGSSGDESEEKESQRHKNYPIKHQSGHHDRARSRSRSSGRTRSPGFDRQSGDQGRALQRRARDLDHRTLLPVRSRQNRSRIERSAEQFKRSLSSEQRSASSTRDRHDRSRSRNSHRHKQRDRSRGTRAPERDDFGRETSFGRSLRQRESKRRHDKRRRSRSRSPVSRRGQRHSRSSVHRRDKRRSRSLSQRRDRSTMSRRREQSRLQQSMSRERADYPVARHQGEKQPESRRKPFDANGKYGLVNKGGALESKDVDKTSLGPNAKYLAKARESKRLEEEERRCKLGKSSREASRKMTDEELKIRAQQMVEDAKERDDYITKRTTLMKDELDKREKEASNSNPDFLRKLHSEAYLNDDSNISDRLRRNAHYIQRKADSSNFLSK